MTIPPETNANPTAEVIAAEPKPDAIVSPVIAAAKESLTPTPEVKAEEKTDETTTELKEQTPEEKAAQEAADAEAAAKAKEEAPKGAPETYEEFQFPEGVQMNPDAVTEFKELAKAANLDQETAQKFAEFGPKILANVAKAQETAIEQVVEGWAEQTRADKELGNGDKAVLDANLAIANKAMAAFASPELRTLLDKHDKAKNPGGTGLGNHPEFVRLMVKVGKAISEDKLVTGNEPGHTVKSHADRLYGNKK